MPTRGSTSRKATGGRRTGRGTSRGRSKRGSTSKRAAVRARPKKATKTIGARMRRAAGRVMEGATRTGKNVATKGKDLLAAAAETAGEGLSKGARKVKELSPLSF